MKDIITLLTTLEQQGVKLALNDKGQLVSQCNKQAMTPAIGQQIRTHKEDIVRCLMARKAYEAPIPALKASEGPLSFSQSGLWFIEQYEDNSHLYNMPVHFRLTGLLDVAALEYAFSVLVEKHASLRTRFIRNAAGKGEQHIVGKMELEVKHHDLSHLAKAEREQALLGMLERDIYQSFDLEQGGLTRVELVRLGEEEHLLMLTQHHIISDGWSVKNMFADFKQAFLDFQNNQPRDVEPTRINYIDYAHWLNSPAFRDYHDEFKPFWIDRLKGIPEVHALPLDKPRPASHDNDGALVFSHISLPTWQAFQRLCQGQSTSYFIGLHAIFSLLMARLGDEPDVVIGTPLAYRERPDIEDVVGFFVNTIVLRTQLDTSQSFVEYLRYCREQDLAAFDHQLFRFEALSEAIGADRTTALNPIFQIMLVYQAKVDFNDLIPGCGAVEEPTPVLPAKTDLSLKVTELVDGVRLEWLYSKGVFEHETVARFAEMFLNLFEAVLASPDCNAMALPLCKKDAFEPLGKSLAALPQDYPPNVLIHHRISEYANHYPDHTAVQLEGDNGFTTLTYGELERAANQLAHWLVANMGSASFVGIAACRKPLFVISALAAWKAGKAYVPLDPAYPTSRLAHMCDDAGLGCILTPDGEFAALHPALDGVIDYSDHRFQTQLANSADNCPAQGEYSPAELAYVIYTSGSTGLPKGVEIEHGAFANVLQDHQQRLSLQPDSRMLNPMSLAFDAGNMTALLPLFSGSTLCFAEPNDRLLEQAEALQASHMICSTALFSALEPRPLRFLKTVAIGGEACPEHLAESWASELQLFNMYGPTECSVTALVKTLETGQSVTIGKPVDNIQAMIVDSHGQLCPVGVPGELYLTGIGLARGYLNQPELTAKAFVECELAGHKRRCYRTGDKARWLNNGEVEYLGRLDQQVKLRGYRIELKEIENQLAELADGLTQIRVIVAGEGARRQLVAYATSKPGVTIDPIGVLSQASQLLPEYMVPAALILIDELPLTVNGKLDIERLPAFEQAAVGEVPENQMEADMLAVWRDVLNTDLGVEDDFFRLGGDSILSIQLNTRLRDAGFDCSVKDVFEAKTVRRLCRHLHATQDQVRQISAEQGLLSGEFDWHPIQHWFEQQPFRCPEHWNQAVVLQIPDLDVAELEAMMSQLLSHHDALRLLVGDGETASQRYLDTVELPPLIQLDASVLDEQELHHALTQLQSGFDLHHGPVMAWAKISNLEVEGKQQTGLFLAFHHWGVDAVSWRIMAQDLARLASGRPLAEKATSYRQWGEALKRYAEDNHGQLAYWKAMASSSDNHLPAQQVNYGAGGEVQSSYAMLQLTPELTTRLVETANKAFDTEVRELLLVALAATLSDMGWGSRQTIMLEGHGREAIYDELDVSQTVGWFTSIFPSTVDCRGTLSDTIRQTKEQLRAIPDNGIGFNALRCHHPQGDSLALSPVVLNYLGRQTQEPGMWRPLPVVPGQLSSPLNPAAELISLHGGINGSTLTLRQIGVLEQALSEQLMAALKAKIEHVVVYCEQQYQQHGYQPTPLMRQACLEGTDD
ncbi:non-ribosomal peptide synthetase [Photobacterium rosenbergii]|uniref:Amino acid adenylation domain-containing protein n=1 Tax=Photobacterium rosenbergii TaxID=294936 RepID=A0ABU3ZMU6_9GAMM|nr:non-ribosomal peptide synthetase [Photobacterium rosenbergii]MDV5171354.1 amino acid adenylation domain-containing protein [Photobacterium rosenbergii]